MEAGSGSDPKGPRRGWDSWGGSARVRRHFIGRQLIAQQLNGDSSPGGI